MKKILLILTVLFFAASNVYASTIVPEKLVRSQSRDFRMVNKATAQIFKNLNETIDVSKYQPVYKNFRTMPRENTQLRNFIYVKDGNAELMYDRESKELKYVTFRTKTSPRAWIVYSYPSGKLRQVDVWAYLNYVYSFNSDGTYMDLERFQKGIEKEIKANRTQSKWTRMKLALLGQSRPQVQVELIINYKGELEQCKAIQQSKSDEFNHGIYDAIWKSSPFTTPYPFTTRTVLIRTDF